MIKLPSYNAMLEFCCMDEGVKITLGAERLQLSSSNFSDEGEDSTDWLGLLDLDKKGRIKCTIDNIVLILENDPRLKGRIALNDFSHMPMIRGELPLNSLLNKNEGDVWSDRDEAALRYYLEKS